MINKKELKQIKTLAEELLRIDTNVNKKYLIGSYKARANKILKIVNKIEQDIDDNIDTLEILAGRKSLKDSIINDIKKDYVKALTTIEEYLSHENDTPPENEIFKENF